MPHVSALGWRGDAQQDFVSYRRDDDPNGVARIRDALTAKLGNSSVFMNVDDLKAGQRFDLELAKALDACDIFIAVIGSRWLDLARQRYSDREYDYVRAEIAAALQRGINVIPVPVGREGNMPRLPQPNELPEDIRVMVFHQKHDAAHERFRRDITDLITAIEALRKARVTAAAAKRAHDNKARRYRFGVRRNCADGSCRAVATAKTDHDPGRTDAPLPIAISSVLPLLHQQQGFSVVLYRGYCAALAPAVYASRVTLPPPHARLASGWLADLYREGFEPSGSR